MSNIKFRAYGHREDRDNYEMFYSFTQFDDYFCPWNENKAICDHELMRYTGLEDRDGKEIYEGDIIKSKQNKHYWIYEITTASEQFGNTLFAMLIEDNLSSEDDFYTFEKRFFNKSTRSYVPSGKRCEVIGNIHENPELLHPNRSK